MVQNNPSNCHTDLMKRNVEVFHICSVVRSVGSWNANNSRLLFVHCTWMSIHPTLIPQIAHVWNGSFCVLLVPERTCVIEVQEFSLARRIKSWNDLIFGISFTFDSKLWCDMGTEILLSEMARRNALATLPDVHLHIVPVVVLRNEGGSPMLRTQCMRIRWE